MTTISNLEAHGIPLNAGGKLVKTTTVVQNVEQLRSLLDHGFDETGREAHYQALFGGISAPGETGASTAQRLAAHVIGNADLSEEDQAQVAGAFPMTVNVVASPESAGPLTVSSAYPLSSSGGPTIVSFTDVILEQGGYFVCRGTILSFTCNTLTRNGNTGNSALADFNILGMTPPTPAPKQAPTPVGQAGAGANGDCPSAGIAGSSGADGTPGQSGTAGYAGTPGGAGIPSQAATIKIMTALNNPISIYSQSGNGGTGGDGSTGGTGQQGGNGGNGAQCDCTGSGAGNGGDGGAGGMGGTAGDGGPSTDAQGNIAVYVPTQADVQKVSFTPEQATPGNPGNPGYGGAGGAGGNGGSGGKNNGNGNPGGPGTLGAQGEYGQPGSGRHGAAAQITVSPL